MNGQGQMYAYKNAQVSTVNKSKLVIMMYEGAIRFVNQAKTHMAANNVRGTGESISRAQSVINELASVLNHKQGGEVATGLASLYMEINRSLTEANMKQTVAPLDHALEMLSTVKDAWETVAAPAGAVAAKPAEAKGYEAPKRNSVVYSA